MSYFDALASFLFAQYIEQMYYTVASPLTSAIARSDLPGRDQSGMMLNANLDWDSATSLASNLVRREK
jgi:hypothetical protein